MQTHGHTQCRADARVAVGSGGLPEVPGVCQGRDEVGGPSPEPAGSEARPGRPLISESGPGIPAGRVSSPLVPTLGHPHSALCLVPASEMTTIAV